MTKPSLLDLQSGVALPQTARQIADAPIFETTVQENLIIKRFIMFALADVHYQLSQMSHDRTVSKREFAGAKQAAESIGAYLAGLMAEVERGLAQPLKMQG